MAQHDYVIDNQSFPATRTDINNALLAISSTNSGTSAPSTTYANQLWYDTTNNKLYIRNEDNDAWIPLLLLDQSNDKAGTLATQIDVEDASGTNAAGTALTVKGGAGTGSGAGGSIIFQTADGGASGSSVNAHATRVTITDDGNVGIGRSPNYKLDAYISGSGSPAIASSNDSIVTVMQSVGTSQGNIGTLTSHPVALIAGNAERARILAGGGLTFNGNTATANALDSYEEGSFTPTYTASSSNPTVGYQIQNGRYVKIGQLVHCSIRITTSSVSGGSGSLFISGLPFAPETVNNMYSTFSIGYSATFNTNHPQSGFLINGGTSIQLLRNGGNISFTALSTGINVSDMVGAGSDVIGQITYRTSA